MKLIYKYELPEPLPHNIGSFKLITPGHFHALHVGEVDGKLYIWGEVTIDDEENSTGTAYLPYYGWVAGTGADLGIAEAEEYTPHVGSVIMKSGYVWHVYGH